MNYSYKADEYNFDGLVGPTHNHAGLSFGNIASVKNKKKTAYPRKAALQGLEKMKLLMDKGFKQGIFPPHERPAIYFLKQLGFTGSDEQILKSVWSFSPNLLAACYSSSSMWAANCATVSPSADTKDQKVHFTPSNLQFFLHRYLESDFSAHMLKKIFFNPEYFIHHPPLPPSSVLSDEGAANHNRLCFSYAHPGVEVFVYGRNGWEFSSKTKYFTPRQTREASQIIVSRHKLHPERTMIVQQHPKIIDAGVFHNDVICTTDRNLIFYHELSFMNTEKVIQEIERKLKNTALLKIKVKLKDLSLPNVVNSYLFNSQLLPLNNNQWLLLAPKECETNPVVNNYLKELSQNSPIHEICYIPIKESMQNGGGPACLRLRIVLRKEEARQIHQDVILNLKLYQQLKEWINKHYREKLDPEDLLDGQLIKETREALNELSQILNLGNIYSFQQ